MPSKPKRIAIDDLRELAEDGSKHAQFALATRYYLGLGVKRNYSTAAKWIERSSHDGYSRAQGVLGWLYYWGRGIKRDRAQAYRWFRRAARGNIAHAQFGLATLYENGEHVTKNLQRAKNWWLRAAKQGHPGAQMSIAGYYAGYDRPGSNTRDGRKAWYWFKKSAQGGASAGQFIVGSILAKGTPRVRQNRAQAYYWLSLAMSEGVKEAVPILRRLTKGLRKTQLATIRREIKTWKLERKDIDQTWRWMWLKNPRRQ